MVFASMLTQHNVWTTSIDHVQVVLEPWPGCRDKLSLDQLEFSATIRFIAITIDDSTVSVFVSMWIKLYKARPID